MSGGLFQLPRVVPLSGGAVIPHAKLTFTLSGTTTPTDVYSDIDLTTPHPSPVVADSAGVFAPIYLDPEIEQGYRVRLTRSDDSLVYQTDHVFAPGDSSARYDVVGESPEIVLSETDQDVNDRKFRVIASNKQVLFQIGNEAESVWTTVLGITRDGTTNDGVELTTGTTTLSKAVIAEGKTGSFAPSWSGFSTGFAPTGDVLWEKVGDRVTLKFGSSPYGTSNSTGLSFTGLPAELRPSTAPAPRYPCLLMNNGLYERGAFGFGTPAGKVVFYDESLSDSGFDSGNGKGLPPFSTLTYSIGQ